MSSSIFFFFGATVVRTSKTLSSVSPLSLTKPLTSRPRHLHKLYTSSYAALNTRTDDSHESPAPQHPWPEWIAFVDSLKSKGYLIEMNDGSSVDDAVGNSESIYKDMNLLKNACLSFSRDRFDIFKSIPTDDIQTIVKDACPNLLRKVVNSAKRLRAYVGLDEGLVCSACNLRGSCDRAYVTLKEVEAAARTVDVMRILLFYALDPLVILGGVKPPGGEQAELSSRRLLSELLELSEVSPHVALPQRAIKASFQKTQVVNLMDTKLSQNVDMKRGDWMCPKCNFLNFSRNVQCMKCNEDGPRKVGIQKVELNKGDWMCPECNFMNFSRNIRCLKCKVEGPKKVSISEVEMKKGDWNCPQCGIMNFASKTKCFRCTEPRPPRKLNPGEWECPSCDFLNYRRNLVCLKCQCKRTRAVAQQFEDQVWRKPQ
ncbi:hypothetical protein Nepgr_019375 [Nepenthes gracilis]|uniref:RanBP2-type domain-containing protein n=1 Tax=Nepenthes gracilis TaxID=150966 RepID=A0AAD3XUY8_NEPGR|nr:hypothetical protein Nepgr_019375 [Nepenthes gracilis]